MKLHKLCFIVTLAVTLSVLISATYVFAASSASPSQPPGEPPYGLNVQGDASGTKLNGVIQIGFSDLECFDGDPNIWGPCDTEDQIYNAASAIVAVRLSLNNNNKEENVHTFYFNLGELVPYKDAQAVQLIVLEALRPYILEAFFGVPIGQNSDLEVYLKDIYLYRVANIEGTDPLSDNVDFTAIAQVTLAVN